MRPDLRGEFRARSRHTCDATTRRKDDVMSPDMCPEELGVSGLGEVDEPVYTGLAERRSAIGP
jgi:hypothetical protein